MAAQAFAFRLTNKLQVTIGEAKKKSEAKRKKKLIRNTYLSTSCTKKRNYSRFSFICALGANLNLSKISFLFFCSHLKRDYFH